MGKYLLLWEVDQSRLPIGVKERGMGWRVLMKAVKEDIKRGRTKDWGAFVGETNGYSIVEGTRLELMIQLQKFAPWTIFKVYEIASVEEVDEMIEEMIK